MPGFPSTILPQHGVYEKRQVGFMFFDFGKAAALTVLLLIVLMAIAAVSFGVLEKRIHYEV